ncbi:MAG: hypothetical protein ACK5LE_03150 [Alphaproteobacteria bacterium]
MGKQKIIIIIAQIFLFLFALAANTQSTQLLSNIYVQPEICNKKISVITHAINDMGQEYLYLHIADKEPLKAPNMNDCWYYHQNLLLSQPSKNILLENINDNPNQLMHDFVSEGTYSGSDFYWIWRQFNILGIGQYIFNNKPMEAIDVTIPIPPAPKKDKPSFLGYDYIVHFYHYGQREPIQIFAKPQDFRLLPQPQIFKYPLFEMNIVQ